MIIVEVDKGIENALKKYKAKRRKVKLDENLRDGKTYTKKSIRKRQQKLKAIYLQKMSNI